MFYTSHLGGACAEARSTHGLSARESTQRSAMRTSYNALLTLTDLDSAHQRTTAHIALDVRYVPHDTLPLQLHTLRSWES